MTASDTQPRGASRKVFGIGLSRTGTASLAEALNILGYRAAHFPTDETTRSEILAHLAQPTPDLPLTLTIMRHHDAATDTPIAATYAGLDRAYPGSLFVLTVRDLESWLDSCQYYFERVVPHVVRLSMLASPGQGPQASPLGPYAEAVDKACYGTPIYDREIFAAAYRAHTANVLAHFEGRDQLLTLDMARDPGWEQLCRFLDREIPVDPFPMVNTRRSAARFLLQHRKADERVVS